MSERDTFSNGFKKGVVQSSHKNSTKMKVEL